MGALRFRKRPIEIEAIQWTGSNFDEIEEFMADRIGVPYTPHIHPTSIGVQTLEGTMLANPGDWIIRGVAGEVYPCKPEIFAETYEPC